MERLILNRSSRLEIDVVQNGDNGRWGVVQIGDNGRQGVGGIVHVGHSVVVGHLWWMNFEYQLYLQLDLQSKSIMLLLCQFQWQ